MEIVDHFVFPSRVRVKIGERLVLFEDSSGLTGRLGLVWQAVAFARYLKEGRVESPVHSLTDSIALAETMGEIERQIRSGARPS